jgi:hypothetical protein
VPGRVRARRFRDSVTACRITLNHAPIEMGASPSSRSRIRFVFGREEPLPYPWGGTRRVIAAGSWASFGYIAAEAELARMGAAPR